MTNCGESRPKPAASEARLDLLLRPQQDAVYHVTVACEWLPTKPPSLRFKEARTDPQTSLTFSMSYTGGTGNDIVLTVAAGDVTAPTITGVFLTGSAWSSAFRVAADHATYGYPVQDKDRFDGAPR